MGKSAKKVNGLSTKKRSAMQKAYWKGLTGKKRSAAAFKAAATRRAMAEKLSKSANKAVSKRVANGKAKAAVRHNAAVKAAATRKRHQIFDAWLYEMAHSINS